MNPRLIKRLDLLAAIAETNMRDDIARLTTTLSDLTAQRATLATYQSRLTASWTNGTQTPTAAAQRAEIFCAAARLADTQITTRETQLQTNLEAALQTLTDIKQRRKKLETFSKAGPRL
jgi:flagellin-like hook-associated protein FlgL